VKEINLKLKIPDIKISIILIIVFCLSLWVFNWQVAIWFLILSAFLIYGWDSRILAGLAIFLFLICFFLMIIKKQEAAELLAIYVFYVLVMTVISQIGEYI